MHALWRKSAPYFRQNAGTFRCRPLVVASALLAIAAIWAVIWIACLIVPPWYLTQCGNGLSTHSVAGGATHFGLRLLVPPDRLWPDRLWPDRLWTDPTAREQQPLCGWRMVLAHYGVTGLNDTNALALLTAIGAGGVFCAVFYSFTTRRLLARLERLQQCVEHASDAMLWVRVTKDGQFFYEGMNQSWQRLSGPPGRDCIGSTPHDVWPKAVADAMVMQLRTIVTTGRAGHYTWPKPGTTDHQISVVITPVRDGNSRRVATLLCQAREVGAREVGAREVGAREVGAREVGAREVGAREAGTVVVQHDHRADIVRRLAAGVAHDFNNVLQAVCSGLELILDEVPSPDPSRELALVALVAARRGNQLTDSLLSYARRQVLTPGPINLREWLPQIAPALEEALGPANQLVLIFAGAPAVVLADETALRAALINLALNAGRAMADGGLLRIETEAGQDPDHFAPSVRIKLFDNGAGMDEVTLARCPEPFFTTLGLTATGLGLSMVQGFAAQSGGSLQLSSRLGEGTTAVLTLPAYLGDIPHGHYPLRDAGESQQGAAAHDLESAIAEI